MTSKNNAKPSSKPKLPKSDFAVMALRAMRKAQKNVERENACYGLPLIVQESHQAKQTSRIKRDS
jgi:hypothetical protein